MASIQPPKTDQKNGPVLKRYRHHRVRFRKRWEFESTKWVNLDYVEALTLRESAAPSKSTAQMRFSHGKIKREDGDGFEASLPWDLRDSFVQVILLGDDNAEPKVKDTVLFTGYLPEQASELKGVQAGATPTQPEYGIPGDETLTVVGMEHLLDRDVIATAWVVNRNEHAEAFQIDQVPVFNETYSRGFSQGGNRSTAKYPQSGDVLPQDKSFVFTSKTDQGVDPVLWSVRDIIEYMLAWFVQGDVRMYLTGPKEVLDALDKIKPPRFDAKGLTVFDALNKLLDRRRGFGWTVRVDADPAAETAPKLNVYVFTTMDETVAAGDTILPANKDTHEIKLDQEKTLADCMVGFNSMTHYGKIVVRGSPLVCMFTISFADGTLKEMWTPAEENTYRAGAGGDDKKKNDAAREDLSLRHVFTSYKVPREWGWIAKDGLGGGSGQNVVPKVKLDGTVDKTLASPSRDWGQLLLDILPKRREQLDNEHEKDYERPFALIKTPIMTTQPDGSSVKTGDRWEFVDRLDGERMSLRMLDKEFGIEVMPTHNHLVAKNHWSNAKASAKTPAYDYKDIVATVAVRADVALSVSVDLWNDASSNPQNAKAAMKGRVLYLDVDDAELWFCVPGTITGVAADGTLKRYGGDGILRDDGPYLRQLAAMSKAWYSKDRAIATITFQTLELGYQCGSYIKTVQDAWGDAKLNCIVSERVFDLRSQTTTLQTSFEELRLDGRNNPTPGLGKV